MQRLTRTQKYADLRDQLAQDAEQSLSTPQLDEYANRLNQLQGQAMPGFNNFDNNQAPAFNPYQSYQAPVQPQYQQQQYQQNPYVQQQYVAPAPVVEPVQPTYTAPQQPQYIQNPYVQAQQQYVAPTPAVEPTPVQPTYVAPTPAAEPVQPTYAAPAQQKVPTFDDFVRNTMEIKIEPEQPVQPQPTYTNPFAEVKPEPVVEPKPYVDPFMNQQPVQPAEDPFAPVEQVANTFEQAPQYNEPKQSVSPFGNMAEFKNEEVAIPENEAALLDELGIMNIEDVKQQTPANNQYVQNPFGEAKDQEFTNTVSMEINKIMEEVAPVAEPIPVESFVEPEKTPSEFVDTYFDVKENTTKVMIDDIQNQLKASVEDEDEDVVEIMSYNELEATHDEIQDTIPFAINTEDEEDEYYDEDEDDAGNTVLNVILIVLIIILVAVLGLIVFYILKTKGIIG